MNLQTQVDILANKKLHYRTAFQGIPISVENRKGSVRKGVDKDWGPWKVKMQVPYGYVKGTKHIGMDGAELDVFIGPDKFAKNAYIVMIKKSPEFKKDDEEKCLLGFPTASAAKAAFLTHFDDARFFGSMRTMPMDDFRKWVMTKPEKSVAADIGEPGVYDGGMGHIDPQPTFGPPSLRNRKRIPTDSPGETDDSLLDVTKRKAKATKDRRDSLTRQHTDANMRPLNTTLVQGFPSVSIGGFG